ncbi:hypothetical protein BJ508DRAFT_305898 [Ascobolus immersus RN42]|uniref:Uncharacterized protein n=1 Tax=Ascobolus immersus RN42 TaxID=1160509 RepID=A0A3N4IDL8_ASCIM|nr:hypothetical protein BJ508DRAFT_305898 [Ascobolus immersus RN42]
MTVCKTEKTTDNSKDTEHHNAPTSDSARNFELHQLIRAGTTFLSRVAPMEEAEMSGGRRHLKAHDQAAVLFATEKDSKACILVKQGAEVMELFAMSMESSPASKAGDTLASTIGSEVDGKMAGTVPRLKRPFTEDVTINNWLRKFMEEGPFDQSLHGYMIQLFTNAYRNAATKPEERKMLLREFQEYIIMACYPKILEHYTSPIHSKTSTTFLDHFRCSKGSCDIENMGLEEQFTMDFGRPVNLGYYTLDEKQKLDYWAIKASSFRIPRQLILTEVAWLAFQVYIRQPAFLNAILWLAIFIRPRNIELSHLTKAERAVKIYGGGYSVHYKEPDAIVSAITDWIRKTTQGLQAMTELAKLVRTELHVTCLELPSIPLENTQASLDALLRFTLRDQPDTEVTAARCKALLHEWTNERAGIFRDEDDFVGNVLRGATQASWEKAFSGNSHLQSMVACMMSLSDGYMKGINMSLSGRKDLESVVDHLKECDPSIGVSELCCKMCHLYMITSQQSGDPSAIPGTSGRVLPWTTPPWESRTEVLQAILNGIAHRVFRFLAENNLLGWDDDCEHEDMSSDKESDCGSASSGEMPMEERGKWVHN